MRAVRDALPRNLTEGDRGLSGTLVPRSAVHAAVSSETAYSDLSESLTSLILWMQDDDPWTRQHAQEVEVKGMVMAGGHSWTICSEGLLHSDG